MKVLLMAGLLVISGLLSVVSVADETPSPAELALQAQQEAQRAAQFQVLCEQILLNGTEVQRADLITQLAGQTCAEAAQL